jgi:hypothetical protein
LNHPTPGPIPPNRDYPGYQPGKQRGSNWLWISLVIAAVIIVVLSAVVITQLRNNKSETTATTAAPTSTTMQSSPPPGGQRSGTAQPPGGSGSPTMTCEGFTASVDASSQPGWHATINHLGLAYAAPPDWKVATCGVRMGWAKPCAEGQCVIRELGAVATVANPACPKQNLAMAGVTQSNNADIKAALDEESKTVPLIYTQGGKVPTVKFSEVRDFTIGDHPAVQMVATVNDIATDQCTGSSALHSMVVTTVPNVEGSVVFLISLRQGVNATPKADVINKMVDTLRSPA